MYLMNAPPSPFACVPIRYAFEAETTANSTAEGARLMAQVDALQSYHIPNSNIHIDFQGQCTMVRFMSSFCLSVSSLFPSLKLTFASNENENRNENLNGSIL